jgi:hypothetical protein
LKIPEKRFGTLWSLGFGGVSYGMDGAGKVVMGNAGNAQAATAAVFHALMLAERLQLQ